MVTVTLVLAMYIGVVHLAWLMKYWYSQNMSDINVLVIQVHCGEEYYFSLVTYVNNTSSAQINHTLNTWYN